MGGHCGGERRELRGGVGGHLQGSKGGLGVDGGCEGGEMG